MLPTTLVYALRTSRLGLYQRLPAIPWTPHVRVGCGFTSRQAATTARGEQVFDLRMTWLRNRVSHISTETHPHTLWSALLAHLYHSLCTTTWHDVTDIVDCMPLVVSWIYHKLPSFCPVGYNVIRFPLVVRLAELGQQSRDHHDGRIQTLCHRIDGLTFDQHRSADSVNVDEFLFKTTRGDDAWWPEVHCDWMERLGMDQRNEEEKHASGEIIGNQGFGMLRSRASAENAHVWKQKCQATRMRDPHVCVDVRT
ncbi:uncharacterized protein DS421_3g71190 [Arachis hypogaea]|nr:uncharacterized protein DS421_3g71190 [Arachis hypogaea]